MHRTRIANALASLLLLPAPALAAESAAAKAPERPPPAPEVKKTVDAFAGATTFDCQLTLPGMDKPAKFKMTFNCKKTALGRAVECAASAPKTSMGPWQGHFMVAYDEGGKAVHFMAVTSEGEVHDHVCQWKDGETMICDPLRYMLPGGGPATEDVTMAWSGKKVVTFASTASMSDGSKVLFSGRGTRAGK
jgi:hypothetical protein